MPVPINVNAQRVDLSARLPISTTVVASPAANAETIIASLAIPLFGDTTIVAAVLLQGWAAYTVGTSGTAVNLRIRQTNVSGTVVAATGALTKTAAQLYADDVGGQDATPGVATYVLTMTVTGGAAPSTVSAVSLSAAVV
jgi:hypothetical protein